MLGEPENQFSFTRASLSTRGTKITNFLFFVLAVLLGVAAPPLAGNAAPISLVTARSPAVPLPSGGNGDSVSPTMTPDGRFVLFSSMANNLVTNGNSLFALNLYLRDRVNHTTMLVSANTNGTGGDASSGPGQVSADGRYVVFQSDATDLFPGDTNNSTDIFVRDLQTGSTTLVSVATNGARGNTNSTDPAITPDGRYVAFVSAASNLVTGDTNKIADVLVRDLVNQTTTLVSVGAINSGISTWRQTSTPSGLPAITPDGSKVAFFSYATGMVPGVPTNSLGEVYLYDLAASNMFWVSSNAFALSGFDSNSSPYFLSYHPAITQDGRFVSFKLSAYNSVGSAAIFEYDLSSNSLALVTTNALPPAYNDDIYGPEMTPDGRFITYASGVSTGSNTPPSSVYLTDMQAGTNYLVSICQDGSFPTNSMSHSAVVSSNGQFVAFLSNASNLVPNTVSSGYHVYLRDTFAGTTTLVDADTNGVGSSDEYGTAPALSTDGRWVAFTTPDGALFPRDNNHALDVVMRDAVSGTNELISCRNNSCPSFSADGLTPGSQFSITPDGRWAVFSSYADDLVPNDSNQNQDVFVRDLHNGTTTLVSAGLDGNPALGGESGSPVISTNGRYVAFASFATNLVPNYTNPLGGVFVRDLLNGTNILVSVATNGITPGNGSSLFPAMSQDGRYIIFLSTAANLLKTSATAGWNVYWRDMISGYTLGLVTNFPSGNSYLFPPSISADGRYVAYNSSSSGTLTVWDAQKTNNLWSASATSAVISPMGDRVLFQSGSSLYVMNVTNKTSTSWATTTSPVQGKAPWSADGRYFTYVVSSSGASQVYLGDLGSGTSTLLSTAPDHVTSGNGLSDNPALSGDARFILYRSSSTNLSSGILPASFVVSCERATGSNTVLTTGTSGDWNSYASQPVADGTGQTFLFQSVQSGLVTSDLNRLPDLFALMSDSDSDGIPDWWMLQYFGHSTGQASDSSRAQDDADGDGFTNLQEFLTGTNPTDPSSFFHLDVSTLVSNQTILLSWPAVSGRSYQLQYTTDLSNPAWSNLGDPIVAEPTGTMAISPSQPAVFYRIIAY